MSSKKYLIDLDEHIQSVISIGVTDSGNVYTIGAYKNELKGLNSYAESEYKRGLNDGSLDVKQRVEGAYQRGLEDAWESARKIIHMPEGDLLNIFTECYSAVCTALQVLLKYDASEAIAKLKAYEDKQKDRIEVGDEVERYVDGRYDGRAMFLAEDGDRWTCLFWTGCGYTTLSYPKSQFKRTGRHYEIEPILEGVRNES